MATMKAAVCEDKETLVITDVPRPEPKADEALVEVKATGLCGSDVDGYTGHHPMIQWPIILGHECSGVVAEVGSDVEDWTPGDEVVIEPFFNCKKCPACLRGEYNLCVDLKITGHQVNGSLADYVIADPFFLHHKPENLPCAEVAIAEPVSGSLHAVERVAPRLGDFVVVLGCGTIGVLAMQHCLNKGAEVLVAEPEAFKRKVAADLGAHHTLDPHSEDLAAKVKELTGGIGADVVVEACGLPETLAATVTLVRRGGRIM
ncbi:MAG: zinc-dependent alcohol dehydrogenase, partial [Planctomycetota bacterium]